MDTRDILKATESTKRLVQDEGYYKYIFKKTEKVVSVIFYVSNSLETDKRNQTVIEDILEAAREVHNAMLRTLEIRTHVAEESLREAAHTLIVLDSKLRVAATINLVSPEVLSVLAGEIDGVLRGINKYLVRTTAFDDLDYQVTPSSQRAPAGPARAGSGDRLDNQGVRPSDNQTSGGDTDRRERIKVVLKAKPAATIKDIADIITDVSSKTIQRELNAMIEDNVVKRQGERRWSRYSLTI